MDKIPIISLILYSFPESIVFISLGSALYGYNVRENFRRILLYGLCMTVASYFIRALPLEFGEIIAILLVVFTCLAAIILRLGIIKATFAILTSYIILQLAESTIMPLILNISGLSFDQVIKDSLLRVVIPWVYLSLLALLTLFVIKKKISFVPTTNPLEPKTASGKMILWLIGLILLQSVIGLTINLVFFINIYSNNAPQTVLLESKWLTQLLGLLLVALPLASIFMIRKLFNLVEKENIIASQEAFIDNINNLFNTIRAQRHDFLNHVQILDSYLKMNKISEAIDYMSDIIEETKEISEIIIINNPFLNALLQAKMGIAQRNKINFSLDIQSSLTDTAIKPFDLVKILGNLINNAIEAVKDLESEYRLIKLAINKSENNHIVEISNPRPVIPPDNLAKIFGGGFTTKTSHEHCGVGLAVVKNLAEKYNGTVTVRSTEADGTTFTLTLPVN